MAEPSEGEGNVEGPLLDQEGRRYRFVDEARDWVSDVLLAPIEPIDGEPLVLPGPYLAMLPINSAGESNIGNLLAVAGGCAVPPCPTPLARLKKPGKGMVLQADSESLEAWWRANLGESTAIPMLFEVLGEVCDRLGDFQKFSWESDPGDPLISGRTIRRCTGEPWRIYALHRADPELPDVEAGLIEGWDWPPEVLFRARRNDRSAADSWRLGELILRMLRFRTAVLAGEGGASLELSSPSLRAHRCRLIEDLFLRKPSMGRGRPLNSNDFLYPRSLPTPDTIAIAKALDGFFGAPMEAAERRLGAPLVEMLSRAMSIDPAERYLEARELGSDLRAWAKQGRTGLARQQGKSLGLQPDSGTETRLVAGYPSNPQRAEGPGVSGLTKKQVKALSRSVEELQAQLISIGARLATQEKNLEAVSGMETGSFEPIPQAPPRSGSSSGIGAAWLLGALNLLILALLGTLLWSKVTALEELSSESESNQDAEEVARQVTTRSSNPGPEWEAAPAAEPGEEVEDSGEEAAERGEAAEQPPQEPAAIEASSENEQPDSSSLRMKEARPAATEAPDAVAEAPVTEVRVQFRSGTGFLLDGSNLRADLQRVPPGRYQVWWSKAGGEPELVSSLEIPASAEVKIKCGFNQCVVD